MNNPTKVLAALLLGAAAGAVLGLLFAPMTGEELRENIKTKAGDLSSQLKEKAEAGMNYARNIKKTATDTVNDMMGRSGEEADYTS